MDPADRDLRKEWIAIYNEADAVDKKGFKVCDIGGVVQQCPLTAGPPSATPPPPVVGAPLPTVPPPSCKIEVRANKLSWLGYYHMFIVFTNAAGEEFYLRGGPSGKSGGYGDIVTQYDKYKPGTIDWDPAAKSITVMNDPAACAKDAPLIQQMDAITASHTPYDPLGPNSNSTVFTALRNVGVTPAVPDGVWAPGKDVPIKVSTP